MNKQLREKIKNELVKCGFPLEIYCRRELWKGVGLGSDQYYLDSENKLREIDGEGAIWNEIKYKDEIINLFARVVLECKKSDKKQWVFFYESPSRTDLNVDTNVRDFKQEMRIGLPSNSKGIHYYNFKNVALNYVIPFCNPNSNESRQIYDGLLNVVNFCEHEKREATHYHVSSLYIHLYFLCVVYDGIILMAEPTGNTFKLRETNHLIVNVNQRKEFKSHNYSIDIVHRSYFKKYIEIIKQDYNTIKECIQKP